MKSILLFIKAAFIFILFLSTKSVQGQTGVWTWVSGDSIYNGAPVYGVQGIPAAANKPGAMYEPCEWKDNLGNLWLYGGYSLAGVYTDLWKFDIATNEWTWIKGPGALNNGGSYGVQGVPNISNYPPARFCSVSWTDAAGDLWMFGGSSVSNNKTDDLWRYNIASNTWTWMKGSQVNLQLPVYGIQGISAPGNTPGARYETTSSWVDTNDDLWFFGGYLHSNTNLLNDLWKYEKLSGNWVWMKGSAVSEKGNYGVKGVDAFTNNPGARQAYSSWKDASGNFYMFGGLGFDADSLKGNLDDLWRFSPATNNWTWIHGTDSVDGIGNFGNYQLPSPNNLPPARLEHRSSFQDACGNFWMFGGISYYVSAPIKYYNDFWKYDLQQNLWTWMGGDSSYNNLSIWGVKNVAAPSNKPGGRSGSLTWYTGDSTFYMYGGFFATTGVKILGDTWKFKFDTTCTAANILPVAAFTLSDTAVCEGNCFNLIDQSQNNPVAWQWNINGPQQFTSALQNPGNICPTVPGNYSVTLIVCNAAGCDTISQSNVFVVDAIPVINLGADTLICDDDSLLLDAGAGYDSYSWNNGATTQTVYASASGLYFVNVVNGECNASDTILISTQSCALPLANFYSSDSLFCAPDCIDFFDVSVNNPTSWQWTFTGAQTLTSTLQNPTGICYQNAGVFAVTLIACNPFGCDTLQANTLINVDFAQPVNLGTDTIICIGDSITLNAGAGYNSYLWSTGETTQSILVSSQGSYNVTANAAVCESTDTILITTQLCLLPVAQFSCSDTLFCEKQCLDFTDLSGGNATSWQWTFTGASPAASTLQNPTGICYNNYGVYDVTLIACNSFGCDTLTFSNFIEVFQNPVDSIWNQNDTLFSLPAYSYQWYEINTGIIAGATNQYFVPQTAGSFYCVITDSIGCVANSNTLVISGMYAALNQNDFSISLFPNPSSGEITIELNSKISLPVDLNIYDAKGTLVYKSQIENRKQKFSLSLNAGIYRVEATKSGLRSVMNLIIEK